MMRAWTSAVALLVILATLAGSAVAALEVRPKRVAADANVTFVLRVHSVWPDATTQAVKIQFPEEIAVPVFDAPPLGWSTKPLKAGNGDTVGVMYHGGAIPEGTHQDFFVAARTVTPGRTLWTAEQFYDNGVVARFSLNPGAPSGDEIEADGAAAIVTIVGQGSAAGASASSAQGSAPPPRVARAPGTTPGRGRRRRPELGPALGVRAAVRRADRVRSGLRSGANGRLAEGGASNPRRPMSARRQTRLSPETFQLPVERMREGYYSDAYFNFTRDVMEADDHRPHRHRSSFSAGRIGARRDGRGAGDPQNLCRPTRQLRHMARRVGGTRRHRAVRWR